MEREKNVNTNPKQALENCFYNPSVLKQGNNRHSPGNHHVFIMFLPVALGPAQSPFLCIVSSTNTNHCVCKWNTILCGFSNGKQLGITRNKFRIFEHFLSNSVEDLFPLLLIGIKLLIYE